MPARIHRPPGGPPARGSVLYHDRMTRSNKIALVITILVVVVIAAYIAQRELLEPCVQRIENC